MIVSLKPIKEEAVTDLDYSAEKIEASMVANASLALSLYTRYHTRTVEIRIIRVRILFFFFFFSCSFVATSFNNYQLYGVPG